MKILSQDMIDRARELIATAAADLVAAHRIVVNSHGSHFVRRNLAEALSEARGALLNIAMTKLPASARSPKLKRMEGMARRRIPELPSSREAGDRGHGARRLVRKVQEKRDGPLRSRHAVPGVARPRDRAERRRAARDRGEAEATSPVLTAWRDGRVYDILNDNESKGGKEE